MPKATITAEVPNNQVEIMVDGRMLPDFMEISWRFHGDLTGKQQGHHGDKGIESDPSREMGNSWDVTNTASN